MTPEPPKKMVIFLYSDDTHRLVDEDDAEYWLARDHDRRRVWPSSAYWISGPFDFEAMIDKIEREEFEHETERLAEAERAAYERLKAKFEVKP